MAATPKCRLCEVERDLVTYQHRIGAISAKMTLCRLCAAEILINTQAILAERSVGKFRGITISRSLVEAIEDQAYGEREWAMDHRESVAS